MDLSSILSSTTAFTEFIYSSPFGILFLFLFTIFANASLFLPIFVEPVIFAVGVFAPNIYLALIIGIITGIAAAIGEMSGYIFGLIGIKTLKKFSRRKVDKILDIGEKLANKGIPIIFLGALTPFPFDLIGLAAGLIRYNPKKFFAAAAAGKIVRYTLIVLAGFFGAAWAKSFFGI